MNNNILFRNQWLYYVGALHRLGALHCIIFDILNDTGYTWEPLYNLFDLDSN